jgi:hypothetical protein
MTDRPGRQVEALHRDFSSATIDFKAPSLRATAKQSSLSHQKKSGLLRRLRSSQ